MKIKNTYVNLIKKSFKELKNKTNKERFEYHSAIILSFNKNNNLDYIAYTNAKNMLTEFKNKQKYEWAKNFILSEKKKKKIKMLYNNNCFLNLKIIKEIKKIENNLNNYILEKDAIKYKNLKIEFEVAETIYNNFFILASFFKIEKNKKIKNFKFISNLFTNKLKTKEKKEIYFLDKGDGNKRIMICFIDNKKQILLFLIDEEE